jgi:pyridoxal phosphate enzyme (YggS family)
VTGQTRREQLEQSLEAVQDRIAKACERAGREPQSVRLLPVTKTFPAEDVATLIDIGLREFAENRDHEASAKTLQVAKLRPEVTARWHMVGRLQRNKARSVVAWADEVQSLDSARLADALARAVANARERGDRAEPLDVQIQASIDGDPARGGCPLEDLPRLADHITRSGELRLRGLMAVAPLEADPVEAFALLQAAYEQLRHEYPGLTELSAGMSGDLEQAIAHGSTRVRVGTALLGHRELA